MHINLTKVKPYLLDLKVRKSSDTFSYKSVLLLAFKIIGLGFTLGCCSSNFSRIMENFRRGRYALVFLVNWLAFNGGVGVWYLALGLRLWASKGFKIEGSKSWLLKFSWFLITGFSLDGSKILREVSWLTFWGVFRMWLVVPASSKRFFLLPTEVYKGDFFLRSWTALISGEESCCSSWMTGIG